jgi:ribosomal subunit interface protein
MNLRITGKNMDIGDSLRQKIEDRIDEAVSKYFDGGYSGHVTVEKSGSGFNCDCMVHLDTGIVLQAKADMGDAIACFDAAAERVEKRLRRYKRRLKDHHNNRNSRSMGDASYVVMESPEPEMEIPENFSPVTIAESSKQIRTQSVADAVMQLDLTDEPVIVFTNAANDQVNVVYRRSDGNIGWIDPARNSG